LLLVRGKALFLWSKLQIEKSNILQIKACKETIADIQKLAPFQKLKGANRPNAVLQYIFANLFIAVIGVYLHYRLALSSLL